MLHTLFNWRIITTVGRLQCIIQLYLWKFIISHLRHDTWQMHSLLLAQLVGRICGRSCRTFRFDRIFAQFSIVETDWSEKEMELINGIQNCIRKYSEYARRNGLSMLREIDKSPNTICFWIKVSRRKSEPTYSVMRASRLPIHSLRSSTLPSLCRCGRKSKQSIKQTNKHSQHLDTHRYSFRITRKECNFIYITIWSHLRSALFPQMNTET